MMQTLLVVCGGILLSLDMLGGVGRALASDSVVRLHVDSRGLTGQLTQVTLRAVLGQLHDELGMNYVVSDAELEKVISVTLQKEPLSMALSKILAPWDYAFTLDAGGKIKTLYVMAKVPPEDLLTDTMAQDKGLESHEEYISELQSHSRADQRSGMSRENSLNENAPLSDLSASEGEEAKRRMSHVAVSMEIRPPDPGTFMPILPANKQDMRVTPVGSRAGRMAIIPPSAYPPMNIQPVPDHVQREMLLTLNP